MAQRTALLNWNNINRDSDFSKYIESLTSPWVIEWLEVSSSSVAIWKARVPCERTNGDTIYVIFYNTSAVSISGNGDVYIEVSQTYIDNWELANEDWTGIAEIKVWTMPAKNALKLATKSWSTITDERVFIKKISELDTEIQSLFSSVDDLDERVEALEEADAIDHLEESGLVGELYTLNDKLFKQYTPTLADSTVDCNIGDTSANTQIHIQRQWSGVASNQLKLKVKKTWSPTQNLIVEVRKWVQVTVTANAEAYWYWNEVIASGSIAYSSITTSYAEYTVTLNNNFWGTKWELLDIVVYQNGNTVNASHYFSVACDSTQYSEWFSYVSVNGPTRTRSKLMPYAISDGFAQSLLVKDNTDYIKIAEDNTSKTASSWPFATYNIDRAETYEITYTAYCADPYWWFSSWIKIIVWEWNGSSYTETTKHTAYFNSTNPTTNTINLWIITTNSEHKSYIKIDYENWLNYGKPTWYTWSYLSIQPSHLTPSWYPDEVKNIWETTEVIIYGTNKDWVYIWGVIVWETNDIKTWSITLWNAVWFLEINYNWEIVKVPYYS